MATTRMDFDVSLGRGGARARDDDAPMHLLVLADLGGARTVPLAQRKPLAVDIDSFERVFARIAPTATIDLDGLALELRFESIDDFHPDRLYARLPVFDALRRLRGELADPVQFRRAAAALGLAGGAAAPAPAAAATNTEDTRADVERLLGRAPSEATASASGAAGVLDGFLRGLVAPHIVPDVAHEQRALRAAADAALSALMRRVLHHPRVQALEAAWRGVERLVRDLELGESLFLHLLDVAPAEIAQDLAAHRGDLAASDLHRHLNASASAEGRHWSVVALDQAFGPGADDVQQLATLGAMAARAGATLLAGGKPALAGCADLAALAEPRKWQPADAPELAAWQALRTSPMAPWIGVVLPRMLLRLPYGAATDRIDSFDFEEMPAPREHTAYLWGHASLALAGLAGRAFLQDGWSLVLDAQLELDDLPSHVVDDDGTRRQQPVAEVLLSDNTAQALCERGLMPLVSRRDRNSARLLRWQSLAEPLQALRGLAG